MSSHSKQKINILFFINSLGGGGAEMQLLRLLNNMDPAIINCTLALSRPGGSYEPMLKKHVEVIHLKTGSISSSTYRLIRSVRPLRRLIKQTCPNIVCSVMDGANVTALAAVEKLEHQSKTVLCVQNNPGFKYKNGASFINRLVFYLMKRYYPKADKIVSLTHGVAGELQKMIPAIEKKMEVIHNVGYDTSVIEKAKEPIGKSLNKPLLVACGRLIEQKGYPYLLKAAAIVGENHDFKLLILGKGPLLQELRQLVQSLGLQTKVDFLGFKDNPYKYMAAADIFVLSSLWEGFGNVITEAMACGTAVVSTDCPYGPGDIIEDGKSGLLVPAGDEKKLAAAIERLLVDPDLRVELVKEAKERVKKFEAHRIAKEYEALFLHSIEKKR